MYDGCYTTGSFRGSNNNLIQSAMAKDGKLQRLGQNIGAVAPAGACQGALTWSMSRRFLQSRSILPLETLDGEAASRLYFARVPERKL
jgi:hypothetical protein